MMIVVDLFLFKLLITLEITSSAIWAAFPIVFNLISGEGFDWGDDCMVILPS